jgi:hypothetical protein
VEAGWLAYAAGQADWALDMATRVLALTADPELRLLARQQVGSALVWAGQHHDALTMLIAVAIEAAAAEPDRAWNALGLAAAVSYQTGIAADRQAVLTALGHLQEHAEVDSADTNPAWIRAAIDPFGQRVQIRTRLHAIAGGNTAGLIGAAAWLVDETELAVTIMQNSLNLMRAPGMRGKRGHAVCPGMGMH